MRHWNVEVIKDFERQEQIGARIQHKLSFLNQLIYKLAGVKKERNKQSLIRNFFKTKHFRETDFEEYDITTNGDEPYTSLTTYKEVSLTPEEKDNLIKEHPYLQDMDKGISIPLEEMLKRKIKDKDAIILA